MQDHQDHVLFLVPSFSLNPRSPGLRFKSHLIQDSQREWSRLTYLPSNGTSGRKAVLCGVQPVTDDLRQEP
jgi:hypothetical protein